MESWNSLIHFVCVYVLVSVTFVNRGQTQKIHFLKLMKYFSSLMHYKFDANGFNLQDFIRNCMKFFEF